jgi:hypothetical protein
MLTAALFDNRSVVFVSLFLVMLSQLQTKFAVEWLKLPLCLKPVGLDLQPRGRLS